LSDFEISFAGSLKSPIPQSQNLKIHHSYPARLSKPKKRFKKLIADFEDGGILRFPLRDH